VTTYGWVSFTTDYGTADGFVAACKGVIATISPATRVIDVTHEVPARDVRRGAAVLAQAAPWLPPAVHLAVVDPGVGTDRRGVALRTPRGVLVGPDNGLLVPAAEALGGIEGAYVLTEPGFQLPEVSRTFHGRDVFAPAAAHLCRGVDPARLGPPVAANDLRRLPDPRVEVGDGSLRAEVLTVDAFGNVQLAATAADLAAAGLVPGAAVTVSRSGPTGAADAADFGERAWSASVGATFADAAAGELLVLVDSAGHVAVAVNGANAAAALGVRDGDELLMCARFPDLTPAY